MKYYINLEYKKNYFKLFLLGYTSDGGFFVKDLINNGKKYLIVKMLIPLLNMRKFGEHKIRMEKCKNWITINSPKLTHHADGLTQISGTGIMSGFYKFFSYHKGVSTQSMDLYKKDNDGGPIFIFHTKNLPNIKYKNKNKNSILIKRSEQIIDPHEKPLNEDDYAFVLEFFYLPRKVIVNHLNLSSGTIPCEHPNYGIIPLKYVPAPRNAPGVIGIFTRIISKGDSDKQFAFSLNGGTSTILKNGEFEHLSIVYPFKKDIVDKQKVIKLDFTGVNKFKVTMDQLLFKIKSMF